MDDMIYRQAAIDAMCELMHHWFGGDPKDEIRETKRELGKLPSAQPESDWRYDEDEKEITIVVPKDIYESTESIFLTVGYEGEFGLRGTQYFAERKTGRWIELTNTNHTYVCSVCGRMLVNITDGKNMVTKNYPFCHCGADMRGEK